MKSKVLIISLCALISLTFIAETFAQNRTNVATTIDADQITDLPNSNRNVSDYLNSLYPKTLGELGAGIGFVDDFDETRLCFKAGVLNRFTTIKDNSALYGGVDFTYDYSKREDFSTNTLAFGGKLQIHSPITRTGELQWVNGVKGHYVTGNRKFGNFKDDVTGFMGCLFTGVNLKVCDDFFVGAETNVLVLEDLKIKNENDNEFDQNNSALRLNKGNLVNFTARFKF